MKYEICKHCGKKGMWCEVLSNGKVYMNCKYCKKYWKRENEN